ncbi:ribokinase [Thalassococcus sp. S3]|uniref:ribokinase n=1 Tax=Thalassococcus sp. S3 TaxID=2017482 RepID=UPI001024050E|nr:ribokinase [Thalassococcus sp. S3]QBF34133.1 ribokinase [Thalassococcus sp. S3]
MTIWNLGSINADLVYSVPHLPAPGETLAATRVDRFLGGKGTNMSVAAARAAAHVCHIGAVGADGRWAVERLMEYGVDTRHIAEVAEQTGHAIIAVDAAGENQILLYPGANHAISEDAIGLALSQAQAGDSLIMQNETNAQAQAARLGREMGLRVCYAAAPFSSEAVEAALPFLDFLILNAVEAEQLAAATGLQAKDLPIEDVIVTRGAQGSLWINRSSGEICEVPARQVTPVDTTGAGDTFTGYVLAGLDRGMPMPQAMAQATRAAAIMVTRRGTADVIPDLKDVQDARLA